jgi:hypothetical protein
MDKSPADKFYLEMALRDVEGYIQMYGVESCLSVMSESLKQQLWVALRGPNEPEMDQ